MGLFSRAPRIAAAVSAPAPQQFSSITSSWSPDVLAAFGFETGLQLGSVSRPEALAVPAVVAALRLTAGTLATLPLHQRDIRTHEVVPSTFLSQPDPNRSCIYTLRQTADDLAIEGVALWQVLQADSRNFPLRAQHVPFGYWQADDKGRVRVNGRELGERESIMFHSPEKGLRHTAGQSIRSYLHLIKAGERHVKYPLPMGYFTSTESVDPSAVAVQKFIDDWHEARNATDREYGFVPGAVKFQQVQQNAKELALQELRDGLSVEIARTFGLSPEWLGTSTTSRTYSNAINQRQDLLDFSLLSTLLHTIEQRLTMPDVTNGNREVRFNLDGFLRSDAETRARVHNLAIDGGWRTVGEVREIEDLPPMPKETE